MGHLEESFVFYASYHSDATNKLLHVICVWPIILTGIFFLSYTPPLLPSSSALGELLGPYELNLALVASAVYIAYYMVVEQPGIAGQIAAAIVFAGYRFSVYAKTHYPSCWKYALAIHIAAWVAQLYGHAVHEKRAPALKDNLMQALLMAPLFVTMEVLFHLGYKPDFNERTTKRARENIEAFRASQKLASESKKKE